MLSHATYALTLLSSAAAVPVQISDTTAPAYQYTLRYGTVVTKADGRTTAGPVLVARVTAAGDRARLEVIEGNKEWKTGEVVITTDGGRSLAVLEPRRERYREVSLAELLRTMQGKLKLTVRDSRITPTAMYPRAGEDGRTLGYARLEHEAVITAKLLVFSHTAAVRTETEYWVDHAYPGLTNPVAGFFRGVQTALLGASGHELRREEADLVRQEPVMTVTTTVNQGPRGQVETEVTTLALTAIARVEAAGLDTTIPAHFAKR